MSLLKAFLERKNNQLLLAEQYEKSGSLEIAYLALWAITEHTVKEVEEQRLKQKRFQDITDWYRFLSENGQYPRPSETKINCGVEVKNIPQLTNIEELLGLIPSITKLLQTNNKKGSTKYRDRRNEIAHHAAKFRDINTFQDYKETALSAIVELEEKLKEMETSA